MSELALAVGPLHLVAAVLAVSGAHKLVEPAGAAAAMRAAGVPAALARGRVVGGAELVIGAAVLAFGAPVAVVALGLLYAAFGGFLLVLRRRDAEAPCGCFGTSDAPPGWIHLLLDLGAAAVALVALLTEPASLVDVVELASAPEALAHGLLVATGALVVVAGTAAIEDIRRTTTLLKL